VYLDLYEISATYNWFINYVMTIAEGALSAIGHAASMALTSSPTDEASMEMCSMSSG
jgi:hypothetical protein